MLYMAERLLELATDPEITSPHVRNIPTATPDERGFSLCDVVRLPQPLYRERRGQDGFLRDVIPSHLQQARGSER